LLTRLAGDDGRAWAQFKDHEARFDIEPRTISPVSRRLLDGVDLDDARRRRQANFETLHRVLGPMNTIATPLDEVAGTGPLCYPFLPEANVDRGRLSAQGIFIPVWWPEVGRRESSGFDRERQFVERLLPLPIDHRYEPADMDRLCQMLLQVVS
jgi:hypothetical protein